MAPEGRGVEPPPIRRAAVAQGKGGAASISILRTIRASLTRLNRVADIDLA
jgi:hypothetical protein